MYRVKDLSRLTTSIQKFKPIRHLLLHNAAEAASLAPTKKTDKPRVVVLGSGWAGCRFLKGIDTTIYDVVCIAPRDHMVFTPLLASAAVCSLEFSSVCESVGRIQPALFREPGSHFYLANCKAVDVINNEVHCQTIEKDRSPELDVMDFKVSYDKLVIATGAEATTFGIKGVKEHAMFLREVHHAQEIRRKLLLNLMLADEPGVCVEEKCRLLHCVVVGGGPAGTEFSAELSDFIKKEVHTRHPNFKGYTRVTLIEANGILSSFHNRLRYCAIKKLTKYGVHIIHASVKEVHLNNILLSNGKVIPYGLLVWCTGVGTSSFIGNLNLPKAPGGRIGVDNWLRVPSARDVYAIGDCSGYIESTGKKTPPALAQVAEREGKYLAQLLNKVGRAGGGHANCGVDMALGSQFAYMHLGSMATLSSYKAVVDLRQNKEGKGMSVTGFSGWLLWRLAYLTRVVSWRHRFYVAINWLTTFLFGRDISRV